MYSLEGPKGVFRDAGVVAKVQAGPDGADDEGVPVAPGTHPDGVGRPEQPGILEPAHLKNYVQKLKKSLMSRLSFIESLKLRVMSGWFCESHGVFFRRGSERVINSSNDPT